MVVVRLSILLLRSDIRLSPTRQAPSTYADLLTSIEMNSYAAKNRRRTEVTLFALSGAQETARGTARDRRNVAFRLTTPSKYGATLRQLCRPSVRSLQIRIQSKLRVCLSR